MHCGVFWLIRTIGSGEWQEEGGSSHCQPTTGNDDGFDKHHHHPDDDDDDDDPDDGDDEFVVCRYASFLLPACTSHNIYSLLFSACWHLLAPTGALYIMIHYCRSRRWPLF